MSFHSVHWPTPRQDTNDAVGDHIDLVPVVNRGSHISWQEVMQGFWSQKRQSLMEGMKVGKGQVAPMFSFKVATYGIALRAVQMIGNIIVAGVRYTDKR